MTASQNWLQQVDVLSTDNHTGASDIALGCARALSAYADQAKPGTPQEVEKAVFDVTKKMLRSQAAMAPVVRLLNDVLLALGDVDTVRLALDTIRRVSSEYSALVEQASALVVEQALGVFPHQGTVVTVSNSSAVAKSLILAGQQGYALKTVCLESRPMMEGRNLAESLSRAGLDTAVVVDARCLDEVRHADLALSGVDSMGVQGVVNKVGTGALALAAHTFGVPAYAVGDTSKIWPEALGEPRIPAREPSEVWNGAPANIQVRNLYYEITPWDFLSGIVTERGVTGQDAISDLARSIPVDRRLKSLLH